MVEQALPLLIAAASKLSSDNSAEKVEDLKNTNAALSAESKILEAEKAKLSADNASLKDQIKDLSQQIAELKVNQSSQSDKETVDSLKKALEAAKKAVIEAKKESEKTAVTTFNHKKATTKAELEAIKAKAQKAIGALTENKDEKYLAGAVPTIDGKVVFSKTINIPGKNADEVYAAMYDKLIELIGAESSLDQSALVLSNENEHKLGAKIFE